MDHRVAEETFEIIIAFDRSGRIFYGNRCAREKLDYTEEELQACGMAKLFRQEFQKEDGSFLDFNLEKLEGRQETALYRKNSSCFPVEVRFVEEQDGSICLLAEDITLRNNMDVRIRKLKEEEESNRKARNEFTANVTHELRTPVNGIRGHVITLLDAIRDREQRKTLEIILYCCDNMSSIINNILDFSKMEAGKFLLDEKEFDFYKMMERVIATHTVEINKKELRLNAYIDDTIPRFLIGDDLRIAQILNNLLSNAVKFTLVGQISVDVRKTMQTNDEVELFFMVRDTGIGISKEEQDKLFQSFKQADASVTRRFGGTGLGLSITKQLVEMMNGSVYLESAKGEGSCFSFNLKLHTDKNAQENNDLSETYEKWSNLTIGMEESEEDYFEFGSRDNEAEIRKRMEKLSLAIELGSWEKAETLAETIKALTKNTGDDLKRPFLRLEMAVRKENGEKSRAAYEMVKTVLEEKLKSKKEESQDGRNRE